MVTSQGRGERLQDLPSIEDAPSSERVRLIRMKLRLCSVVYDFTEPKRHGREKEAKRAALQELIDYLGGSNQSWGHGVASEVMNTVSLNIFRKMHKKPVTQTKTKGGEEGGGDDEQLLEPSWPHLQLVYELFLNLVMSKEVDAKTSRDYFSKRFMLRLLNMFDSSDPREREYLKTILHRIYGKCMALRSFLRRSINNLFYSFIYETESFNGIAELLEILGSIINGFAVPLKLEHQRFLTKSLIPLHKVPCLADYHQQLTYCITQFVEKDEKTAEQIIFGLLRYWPITASNKELLFLNELEEILELISSETFQKVMHPLFIQIGKSMCSHHFQVSQRALYMCNNESIINLVASNRVEILPILFGPLYYNSENHWHSTVQTLTYNVLKLFLEMDPRLFNQCSAQLEEREGSKRSKDEDRRFRWKKLERKMML